MNNTFNLQRFGLLLKRQWLEFGRIYLTGFLVALGILVAFYGFFLMSYLNGNHLATERDLYFRLPLFLVLGFIFISVFASNYFAHLGQKSKAVIDLMLPASTFEKFLTGLFFSSLLSIASFITLFYLIDLAFIAKLNSLAGNKSELPYFFAGDKNDLPFGIYLLPFLITHIFLLGSVYFERFHYLKTIISVMIFNGIWTAILVKSGQLLFEGKIPVSQSNSFFMNRDKDTETIWLTVILMAIILVFWVITYLRLKEKEV